MSLAISILYHALTALVAFLLIRNFLKSRKWQEEVLYLIVLIPFLLRLLRLK